VWRGIAPADEPWENADRLPTHAGGPAATVDTIVTVLAVVFFVGFFLWFAIGTQVNIRRGNAFLRWLQGGLPLIGRRTTMRWLGSSAVELVIAEPAAPFRHVTLILVLEPRDLPWLWAMTRTRGRRDLLIVRADLRSAPRADLEVARADSWSARLPIQAGDAMVALEEVDWPAGRWGTVDARASAGVDRPRAVRAWSALDEASAGVSRLSIRRTVPHLEIHLHPPADSRPADRLVQAVRQAALDLAGTRR
jgi:hypothetical protein